MSITPYSELRQEIQEVCLRKINEQINTISKKTGQLFIIFEYDKKIAITEYKYVCEELRKAGYDTELIWTSQKFKNDVINNDVIKDVIFEYVSGIVIWSIGTIKKVYKSESTSQNPPLILNQYSDN